jgi:hypothetical protein
MSSGSLYASTDPILHNTVMAAMGGCRASAKDATIPVRPSREIAPADARPIQKNPALAGKTRRRASREAGQKGGASQAENFPGGTARTRSRRPGSSETVDT